TLSNGAKFLGSVSLTSGAVQVGQGNTLTVSGSNAMSGGTLGGTGTVNISGSFAWSGGIMDGAGKTALAAGATITQTAAVTIQNSRLLEIAGTFDDTVRSEERRGGKARRIRVVLGGQFKKSGARGSSRNEQPL